MKRNTFKECIYSTVFSMGKFVTEFETKIIKKTVEDHAVATVNDTSALHINLIFSDLK